MVSLPSDSATTDTDVQATLMYIDFEFSDACPKDIIVSCGSFVFSFITNLQMFSIVDASVCISTRKKVSLFPHHLFLDDNHSDSNEAKS